MPRANTMQILMKVESMKTELNITTKSAAIPWQLHHQL